MYKAFLLAAGFVSIATASLAEWSVPARGSETRADLMDAIRPHAEWQLGGPVQFVVDDLRVSGALAFASLSAQRPGGAPISIWDTPAYLRGELDPVELDGLSYHVLYRKQRRTWVAVHWSLGATDVWWAWSPICAEYRPVIPEFCQGL